MDLQDHFSSYSKKKNIVLVSLTNHWRENRKRRTCLATEDLCRQVLIQQHILPEILKRERRVSC